MCLHKYKIRYVYLFMKSLLYAKCMVVPKFLIRLNLCVIIPNAQELKTYDLMKNRPYRKREKKIQRVCIFIINFRVDITFQSYSWDFFVSVGNSSLYPVIISQTMFLLRSMY